MSPAAGGGGAGEGPGQRWGGWRAGWRVGWGGVGAHAMGGAAIAWTLVAAQLVAADDRGQAGSWAAGQPPTWHPRQHRLAVGLRGVQPGAEVAHSHHRHAAHAAGVPPALTQARKHGLRVRRPLSDKVAAEVDKVSVPAAAVARAGGRCAVLCCAVLCCAVLCCAVLCCAVLCCAVQRCNAHWLRLCGSSGSAGIMARVQQQLVQAHSQG
jgi:hypothetical protein